MNETLTRFDLISMVVLGLLGTGHCLGMCGPLVVAFPGRLGTVLAHLWYHLGRIAAYTLVGAALGTLGGAIGQVTVLARLQVGLGAVAAVFLLLFGLSRLGLLREPALLRLANPAALGGGNIVGRLLGSRQGLSMLPLGFVMGFLPCGLSYAAFVRALPSGGPLVGAGLLAAFGAGTFPGLLILGASASRIMPRYRAMSDLLAGVLMIAMAVDLGADVLQGLF